MLMTAMQVYAATSGAIFRDGRKGCACYPAARHCLVQCEGSWFRAADRLKHQQYRHAMIDGVVAFAQARIALHDEFIRCKCALVRKAAQVRKYLAVDALR